MVGSGERLEHLPPMLSVGERQRLSLARALGGAAQFWRTNQGNLDPENANSSSTGYAI